MLGPPNKKVRFGVDRAQRVLASKSPCEGPFSFFLRVLQASFDRSACSRVHWHDYCLYPARFLNSWQEVKGDEGQNERKGRSKERRLGFLRHRLFRKIEVANSVDARTLGRDKALKLLAQGTSALPGRGVQIFQPRSVVITDCVP